MRYSIGEIYPFANVVFDTRAGDFTYLYRPWADTLREIRVVWLKCIEHHKVPVAWREDEGPTGDGFIFEEIYGNDVGRIWENQYPKANYGQIDDSQDRIVTRRATDDEEKRVKQMSRQELDYLNELYTDARSMAGNIFNALHGNDRQRIKFDNDWQHAVMVEYLSQFTEAAVAAARPQKMLFAYSRYTFKKKDGTVHVTDFFKCDVIDVEKARAASEKPQAA